MSSSTSRRFGTDVSNIPSNVLNKQSSKKMTKPQIASSKPKQAPVTVKETRDSTLVGTMQSLMETLKVSIDDGVSTVSDIIFGTGDGNLRYEMDFLLSFKESCKEPLEGLIPEVLPGYVHQTARSEPAVVKPKPTAGRNSKLTPVSSPEFSEPSSLPSSEPVLASGEPATTGASGAINGPKEWRVKQLKKQKPRELDSRRLAARQKQIDIGKNTTGYNMFVAACPPATRTKGAHPKTPDINQVCSKRSWDGQVRKWRRMLHQYDPATEAAGDATAIDDMEEDLDADQELSEDITV